MSYFDAVSAGFRNYFDFQGRATRPEFWWFVLFLFLLGLGTAVADASLGLGGEDMTGPINPSPASRRSCRAFPSAPGGCMTSGVRGGGN
jgi:hypothetical protein